jgi:GH18 family chitinase
LVSTSIYVLIKAYVINLSREYPANGKEWENWGLLLKESKETLLNNGENTGKSIVTLTMYLDKRHFEVIQHFNLLANADFLHCMAYDARGRHSTYEFAQMGINLAVSSLGPYSKKWTLGVPFYGRDVRTGEAKAYYDILPRLQNNQSDLTSDNIYFNSQSMLSKKVKLAYNSDISGVMIWELGQDKQPFQTNVSLLRSIDATVKQLHETKELLRNERNEL